jgi:TAT (twin-arginine translocation) pathway signal sequence
MPREPSRRRVLGVAVTGGAATLLAGCAPERGPTVPIGEAARATVLGIPNERFFPVTGAGPI